MAIHYGAYIKKMRERVDLSQDFVAKKIGVSRPTYMQIEQGERDLTITEAKKLAEVFGIIFDDFVQGKDTSPTVVVKKNFKKTKERKQEMRINVPQKNFEKFAVEKIQTVLPHPEITQAKVQTVQEAWYDNLEPIFTYLSRYPDLKHYIAEMVVHMDTAEAWQAWRYNKDNEAKGFCGPPGPKFVEYNKLVEPIKWAGIDKIKSQTAEANKLENIVADNFTLTMKAKTAGQVLVSPHQEFLSSTDESKVLPRFYDIDSQASDLTATLTFNYTDQELADFNITEQELEVIRFDEATQKWQAVESIVDKVNNIVQAVVNHFSIYSLGVALDEFDYQATGELKPQVKSIAYDEQLLLLTFDFSLKNISKKEFSLPMHFVINGLGSGVSLENPDGVDLAGHLFKEYGFKGQTLAGGKSTEIKKIKLTLPARQCVEIEYEVFSF